MSTRGWKVTSSDNPFHFRAENGDFLILSSDPKKFRVENLDGEILCDDLGTSMEAFRVGDALLRRSQTESR